MVSLTALCICLSIYCTVCTCFIRCLLDRKLKAEREATIIIGAILMDPETHQRVYDNAQQILFYESFEGDRK